MRLRFGSTIACTVLVLLVGCNDGGGTAVTVSDAAGGPAVDGGIQTLRYPSGRLQAQGPVEPDTGIRTGHWTEWYDDEAGAKRWEGEYRAGAIDQAKAWRAWNANGSVQADWQDR